MPVARAARPLVLEAVKAAEKQDDVVLIINDLDALKVLKAWERLRHPPFKDRRPSNGESLDQAFDRMWDRAYPNLTDLSYLAKLPLNVVVTQFIRLRNARLLYPDGTLHRLAKAILAREVQSYLRSLIPHESAAA